jgi:hypothetical protein
LTAWLATLSVSPAFGLRAGKPFFGMAMFMAGLAERVFQIRADSDQPLPFCLGTGTNSVYIPGHDLNWGLARWAQPLVNLLIDGVMGVVEFQCGRVLGRRYFRLQPLLPKPFALDDAAAVAELIEYAEQVNISSAVSWLSEFFG